MAAGERDEKRWRDVVEGGGGGEGEKGRGDDERI